MIGKDMRTMFAIAICSLCCLTASEEGLSLRRIADFWEEGEYHIAKNQMEEFLAQFPESSYSNVLCMALGDLFLREKNYKSALDYYARVEDQDRIFLHRLQCLYHLEWHATLADECEVYLKRVEPIESHRLQATYFLAIALYQQCLSAPKESAVALAERARPYFELLSNSELSGEVAGAFAHLCCILKDFEGASKIYLHLAKSASNSQELLFQSALLQSKFDKQLALESFGQLREGPFAAEACYNRLVLLHELNRYREIIDAQEVWFSTIPTGRSPLAHLFVGQSFLHLKEYEKAVIEISAFLDTTPSPEEIRNRILQLVEASYLAADISLLDRSIERLKVFDCVDQELPNALFCRSLLLKNEAKFVEAVCQLKEVYTQFTDFPKRLQVCFEIAQLESALEHWNEAREYASLFLKGELSSELVPHAWRFAAKSSLELKLDDELQKLISNSPFLSESERFDWTFRLAKLHFDLDRIELAYEELKTILSSEADFISRADGELLLAIYFAKKGNEGEFCKWAELALSHKAGAISIVDQHLALFNSYLIQGLEEVAATHLYAAFESKAQIQQANLLWLANFYFERKEMKRAYAIFLDAGLQDEENLLKLAKLHLLFDQRNEALSILESLDSREGKFALAEVILTQGTDLARAELLFDSLVKSETMRDAYAANAALHSARIKLARGEVENVVLLLKDLTLQKNLENEPVHLEAALDYANLQKDASKRLASFRKAKSSFESQEDLLSKDYHAARGKIPEQDQIYRGYMQYLDAQILLNEAALNEEQQNELQTKAKATLLQIVSDENSPLHKRIQQCLHELGDCLLEQ
jgi:hypothetical protein